MFVGVVNASAISTFGTTTGKSSSGQGIKNDIIILCVSHY